jgi:hypothetical protein
VNKNGEVWLIVYLNNQIYSSLCIDAKKLEIEKNRFTQDLYNQGEVKFETSDREPFHGW